MKEAVVAKGPKVLIRDSPIPRPGPGQVVTKIVVSGSNPKDWKVPEWQNHEEGSDGPTNQGDDFAGYVHEVGDGVHEFKKGDRVAGFHQIMAPHGSYAEYGVSWASTTFHLPEKTSFEEGAAIPLAALTAAIGLYARLRLPEPWFPLKDDQQIPVVVYGASSAVGTYALQLAARSNIHPLICIAGRASQHVEKFIDRSKGDVIIDYREGDDAVVAGIQNALQGRTLHHAFDAVSENGSWINICKVLDPQAKITLVLPGATFEGIPDTVQKSDTNVGSVHGYLDNLWDFGYVYSRFLSKGLQEGWFRSQPHEVVPGGLNGIQKALLDLKAGKASAVKYVFSIAETDGVQG